MNQLLIISDNADFSKSIEAILAAPERFECHHRFDLESALNLLEVPLFGACLLDADLTSIKPIRQIERIRSVNRKLPLIVFSATSSKEWEEEAALNGADFILAKPVRGKLFINLLNKLLPDGDVPTAKIPRQTSPFPASNASRPRASLPALEVLRDFSRIFSFSLNLKSFTYQFALKLREITGVNRIAIFLEQTPPSFFGSVPLEKNPRLQCLCSVGIDPELFRVLTLSSRSGIGQTVLKSGRILRNHGPTSDGPFPPDPEVLREFLLLGGQVAIPILDRERAIGVAILGDSLTGQSFSNEELELLFHLMEELGVAIKSNLLHDHLLANHKLITSVFNQMGHGCMVVDSELNILHANPAFLRFFNCSTPVQFSELPRRIAGLLYESAHDGKSQEPFLYSDPSRPNQTYRISILPFHEEFGSVGAMLSVEDFTPVEAARKAELKASHLELTALMAEKFAHEIRNALVPIETFRQLIPEHLNDPQFHQNLETTLKQETRRIGRLAEQLLYLSRQETPRSDSASPADLLKKAFAQVQPLLPEKADLKVTGSFERVRVACDPAGLTHAFVELLLNAFQANPDNPKVTVSGEIEDSDRLRLDFRDQGSGFTPELASRALEPFFTTRNVGVGLGLSVTRKIISDHQGNLEIKPGKHGWISILLPSDARS